jgi:hypothetical protein
MTLLPKMLEARRALRRWPAPKILAAREALRRWPPPKILAAREALRRYSRRKQPYCTAKVDRLAIACDDFYMAEIRKLHGYRCIRSHWVKPKSAADFVAYDRVTELRNERKGVKIFIHSEPKLRKLAPYQITFIPNDQAGLQPEDVVAVLDYTEGIHTLKVAELAADFVADSGVDCEFVRAHSLFGKSREFCVDKKPGWDAWGSRRGAKFVRSYFKEEIQRHRIEVQAQRPLLRENRINQIADLPRLATILPQHHMWFARLNEEKLAVALRHQGLGPEEVTEVIAEATAMKGNLGATLRHLRRQAGLKNTVRLLTPLKLNSLVRTAMELWAEQWKAGLQRAKSKW